MLTMRQDDTCYPNSCLDNCIELKIQDAIVDVAFELLSANMLWSPEAAVPVMSLPFPLPWGFLP